VAGGLNVYGYVAGDPMSFIDPLGLTQACAYGKCREIGEPSQLRLDFGFQPQKGGGVITIEFGQRKKSSSWDGSIPEFSYPMSKLEKTNDFIYENGEDIIKAIEKLKEKYCK